MLVVVLPFFGELTIGYNYVRTRYGWGMVEYSEYQTITEVMDMVGQAIFIPLLGYAQVQCTKHIVPTAGNNFVPFPLMNNLDGLKKLFMLWEENFLHLILLLCC
jgi:hypothetical protein